MPAAAPRRRAAVAKRSAGTPSTVRISHSPGTVTGERRPEWHEVRRPKRPRRPVASGAMRPRLPARRTEHDRDIVRLAVPAFGALVAEPLYVFGRHRDRGAPRRPTAGRPRGRRDRAHGRLRYLQLPRLLHDGAVARRSVPARPRRRPSTASTGSGSRPGSASCSPSSAPARARDRRRDGRVRVGPAVRAHLPAHRPARRPVHADRARGCRIPARHAGHANHAARSRSAPT